MLRGIPIPPALLTPLTVAVTKPNESSFCAYLTELAFRRHLAHIRSSSDEPEERHTTTNGTGKGIAGGSGATSGADTPPIAPFRFANHVAISLRTPSLNYRSYFFFALAVAGAPGAPAYLSDPVPAKSSKQASGAPSAEPAVAYLGVLGHWFVLGQVPELLQWIWRVLHSSRRSGKGRKKNAAMDKPGILEMRAVMPKDESLSCECPDRSLERFVPTQTDAPARTSALVPKLLFKNESAKDLTDLLPLHSTPPTTTLTTESRSRRGSSANLAAPQTPPSTDASAEINSPVLTALKSELASAQSVLAELQAQLDAHDESVSASQTHLQSTLDDLRRRRKEDDAERQDLKAKSKTLEDQKRQAEGARREAEKKLKAVESVRDGLNSKIAAALGEIEDLKSNMELSKKNITLVKEEGERYIKDTRDAVTSKTAELGTLEEEITSVETSNSNLSQQVREAEEKLKSAETAAEDARKIAPEEEMMLMAAAYEAAASETYLHGQRQNQADSEWASQAAAYMAEAGMPMLDQSYTARPAQTATSGYGHLSRPHPNNSSYRSLSDSLKQAPGQRDLSGFENFGPGAVGSGAVGSTRSLASRRPSINTNAQQQAPAPPVEDVGSPISGPMSASFPDSWLPQGLVRSLEGDVTPLDSGLSDAAPEDDDSLFMTLRDAVSEGVLPGQQDISSSDSAEDSPPWRTQDGGEVPARRMTPKMRLSNSASSTHSNSASTHTLQHMGSLPSRRWFSGAPSSSDNLATFNMFPSVVGRGSSDSLPLPGFESAFAPSASEKKALKWPLLNKARWAGNGNNSTGGISGLDEITAGLKNDLGDLGGEPVALSHSTSNPATANGLSAEELFNRAPGSEWMAASAPASSKGADEHEAAQAHSHAHASERKASSSFRFFSLRNKGHQSQSQSQSQTQTQTQTQGHGHGHGLGHGHGANGAGPAAAPGAPGILGHGER